MPSAIKVHKQRRSKPRKSKPRKSKLRRRPRIFRGSLGEESLPEGGEIEFELPYSLNSNYVVKGKPEIISQSESEEIVKYNIAHKYDKENKIIATVSIKYPYEQGKLINNIIYDVDKLDFIDPCHVLYEADILAFAQHHSTHYKNVNSWQLAANKPRALG